MSGPVVAFVPAKDAELSIRATVTALLGLPEVDEVVVVDDGSADATAEMARAAGAWVLRLPANRGKGGAVEAGVELAPHAGIYLLVDADVGPTAAEVRALLRPVLAGEADMAVGVLPSAGRRGGFGLVRSTAAAAIRLATGAPTRAPLSGQRAVRGELLRSLDLAPRFGLEVGLTIDARRAGARVVEVPVEMEHRHTGRTVAGFRHRARQGRDAATALWPRLTNPATRLVLAGLALALVLGAVLWSGGRWEAESVALAERPSRVLLFGMPGLRWEDVGTGRLPNLDRLLRGGNGAVAAMTVRTLSKEPSPVEAYATLGAGARVRAGQVAEEASGAGGPIVVPGAAEVRDEAGRYVPSEPGALGDALHAAGLRTAVVGTADTPPNLVGLTDIEPVRRTVAVALMDRTGRVDGGSVEPADLLVHDRFAAFQERADPDRIAVRTSQALQQADVVLVDPGDLDRAADLQGIAPPLFADRYRARALELTDDLLGRVVDDAPPATLVMVLSPVPPTEEWRLTPLVMWGPGVTEGYVHSPSTRRLGLVTLTDVAPTVLAALGVPVPGDMIGHALRFSPTADADPARLGRLDRDIAFRERIYLPVTLGFIAFQAFAYAVIALVVARTPRPGWAFALRDVALAVAAFPLGTLVFRALTPFAPGLGTAGVVLLPLAIAAVVLVARRARSSPLAPLGWIFATTVALLVFDVATGGRLQVGGLLGYSPQSAGRFYGLGNTTFAVLAACTVLVAAVHVQRRGPGKGLVAVACLFALVVVVDGAPGLGDDVGGILTLVPVFGLTFLALAGRRITWRLVAGVAVVSLAVLAAATAVDLMRPPESRTHLGRLAADTWEDGGDELATTIARKTSANVRLLRQTPWAWAVPVIAGFLLWVLVVRRRWADLLPPGSPLRVGVVGALAAGLLGFAVNDSGIVVTALVLVEVGPVLAVLALGAPARPLPAPAVLLEPTGDVPPRRSLAAPQGQG